jgi:hypothetical protein
VVWKQATGLFLCRYGAGARADTNRTKLTDIIERRWISLQGCFTENAQEGPACRVRGRLRKFIDLAATSVAHVAKLQKSLVANEST